MRPDDVALICCPLFATDEGVTLGEVAIDVVQAQYQRTDYVNTRCSQLSSSLPLPHGWKVSNPTRGLHRVPARGDSPESVLEMVL
jgi:hypothetical protein